MSKRKKEFDEHREKTIIEYFKFLMSAQSSLSKEGKDQLKNRLKTLINLY